MTRKDIRACTTERLFRWGQHFVEISTTPIMLLGVGHNEKSGVIALEVLEDIPTSQVIAFLRFAIEKLEKGEATGR